MTTRRDILRTGALAAVGLLGAGGRGFAAIGPSLDDELVRIGSDSSGRLGVAILDTASGKTAGLHADDRFPMCSTFKLLATAALLERVEGGKEKLDRRITFQASDMVVNSPVTKDHTGGEGMTLGALCEAAMTYSDNTAGNLILSSIGGAAALTAYARSIGDQVTRLDRNEPTLNEATPGDRRDTTTPNAMLKNIQALLLGDALEQNSKEMLGRMMIGNKTGDTRLRAGLPEGWRCGDKTGAGEHGTTNDVGILWPPHGKPILVACYLTECAASTEQRNATIAAIGKAIAAAG